MPSLFGEYIFIYIYIYIYIYTYIYIYIHALQSPNTHIYNKSAKSDFSPYESLEGTLLIPLSDLDHLFLPDEEGLQLRVRHLKVYANLGCVERTGRKNLGRSLLSNARKEWGLIGLNRKYIYIYIYIYIFPKQRRHVKVGVLTSFV